MVLRFLGESVTDSNGLAVLPDGYTGTGAGEIDVVAKTEIDDRIFQSETYTITDCLLLEEASATYELTTSTSGNSVIKRFKVNNVEYCYIPSFCFEFDIESITNPSGWRVRIMEEDTTLIYQANSLGGMGVSGACHIKCVVTETGSEWFIDGVSKYTATGNAENPFSIVLIGLRNNTGSITISNAKVYPI